jgi:hypothetical protein
MKSKIIEDYYKFLREEDENHKGNADIIDDGSEALYCLLFKLMGDQRSMSDLVDIFDMPPAGEFQGCSQTGEYDSVIAVARDHGCNIEENGATPLYQEKLFKN